MDYQGQDQPSASFSRTFTSSTGAAEDLVSMLVKQQQQRSNQSNSQTNLLPPYQGEDQLVNIRVNNTGLHGPIASNQDLEVESNQVLDYT